MKKIEIPAGKMFWDERSERMLYTNECEVLLEHSLYTVSKWEQKYHKRFLDPDVEKTQEELTDYIKIMIQKPEELGPIEFIYLVNECQKEISEYMKDPHTATSLPSNGDEKRKEPLSAELIYYWMFSSQIPLECEHWHLNKLMTLIGVFGVKNAPEKKESPSAIMARNKAQHDRLKRERALKKQGGKP